MSTLSATRGAVGSVSPNGGFTQKDRLLSLTTPLGDDALLVQSLYIEEAISALYHINLQLYSLDPNVPFEKLAGQKATVRIKLPDGTKRLFQGHISRLSLVGGNLRFTVYNMEVVPWLWFLTRTSDCRVFQNLTVPGILAKVFKDGNFGDFHDMTTSGRYAKWDYCVQYRETDFNFVSRLMEQEGIFGNGSVLRCRGGAAMNNLKIFVLGESSGNPEDWSPYKERVFVLAHDKKEAESLHDTMTPASEVHADSPMILCYEPGGGDE